MQTRRNAVTKTVPREDTQFKPGNPGMPKGTKHKKNWMRLDKELAAGGYSILAPFRDEATTKFINEWVCKYAKDETKAYLTDIFIPYAKALPTEIRVKVFSLLMQSGNDSDSAKMMQVIQLLLIEIEALGGDIDEIRTKLPADIG